MSKIHYFYKITNLINNHFYYGIHSTNNINDGYMGSGSRLHRAYKKYGIENFQKEILKYFDTREELAQYEAKIVNEELIADPNCYNIQGGGEKWNTINTVSCIDENGNRIRVYKDDFYKNGYKTATSDKPNVTKGKAKYVNTKGKLIVVPKKDDDFYIKKLGYTRQVTTKNKVLSKDDNGNYYMIDKNDERYLNGEVKNFWINRHHKDETKQKMHETFKQINHQQGEKNSQYGTCWIHNEEKAIKIKKEQLEEYISNGWIKGRKEKDNKQYKRIYVHNNEKNIKTSEKYVQDYLDQGYIFGYKTIKGT